jgi:hypothetical protein
MPAVAQLAPNPFSGNMIGYAARATPPLRRAPTGRDPLPEGRGIARESERQQRYEQSALNCESTATPPVSVQPVTFKSSCWVRVFSMHAHVGVPAHAAGSGAQCPHVVLSSVFSWQYWAVGSHFPAHEPAPPVPVLALPVLAVLVLPMPVLPLALPPPMLPLDASLEAGWPTLSPHARRPAAAHNPTERQILTFMIRAFAISVPTANVAHREGVRCAPRCEP